MSTYVDIVHQHVRRYVVDASKRTIVADERSPIVPFCATEHVAEEYREVFDKYAVFRAWRVLSVERGGCFV